MHENREISCTSCSKEQDRSAKAINRTADMGVQEKSDCAVVPVNQSNKEAQASAESGEGRAQTKENIVQSHKLPTQSGKGLSQGLCGVRQAARGRKQERFTACEQMVQLSVNPHLWQPSRADDTVGSHSYVWKRPCFSHRGSMQLRKF